MTSTLIEREQDCESEIKLVDCWDVQKSSPILQRNASQQSRRKLLRFVVFAGIGVVSIALLIQLLGSWSSVAHQEDLSDRNPAEWQLQQEEQIYNTGQTVTGTVVIWSH